jgi:hypothetical protein
MFTITYDFGNLTCNVGREGRTPVGYGPCGPAGWFRLEELPAVVAALTAQLGYTPTLHLQPCPE